MAKSKKSTKQMDPAHLAEEIASGRLNVRVVQRKTPVTMADALSGRLKTFQPSAWKAPNWRRYGPAVLDSTTGATGYVCDDPLQQAFAVEAMKVATFSLPDFDLWLDALKASPARDELARRRDQLCDAIAENDQVAIGKHCVFLSTRVHAIGRELALWPMIERDNKRQRGTQKPRRPEIDEWIGKHLDSDPGAKSPALWSVAPYWITDQIGVDAFKKRVTRVRKSRCK